MNRILVLTSRFPYPVIGGDKLRIHYICRELARNNSLTLLSICGSRPEMEADFDSSVFSNVERVYLPSWRSLLQVALALPTALPLQIAYYRSAEFAKKLERLSSSHDLILAHLIRTGHYVRARKDVPRVLEMTDAISMNYQRMSAIGRKGIKATAMRWDAARLRNYETRIINDFDLASLVSPVDRDYLLGLSTHSVQRDKVVVAPNGVDLERLRVVGSAQSDVIAFIGNLRSLQNQDACEHFVGNVFPLVRRRLPNARFRVVGAGPASFLSKLNHVTGVEVIGPVDSIPDAVEGAFCGVCPVRIGAGVQNKVLEYFALGLPAVVSPVGFEGLRAIPGEHLIVANDARDMADALIRLHGNIELRHQLSTRGLTLVRKGFNWSSTLRPLCSGIDRLLTHTTKAHRTKDFNVELATTVDERPTC